jgi:probable F420-dependent oxidoreductase
MSKNWKWGILYSGDNMALDEVVASAKQAEDAGAHSLWVTELWRDAFVPLAAIAGACRKVRLGSAVATFARPPMYTELSAMSLAEMTQGNFVLGLGTAPLEWNQNWHGVDYSKPATRMREYVECIRAMWTANPMQPISYKGEYFDVKNYIRYLAAPYEDIPIYLAAVQPGMLKLAGAHADGLIVNSLNTLKYFNEIVHPNIKTGLDRAGRSKSDFEICSVKCCAINKDAKQARQLAKHVIAFYSTVPYFDIVLDPMGFTEAKLVIRDCMARMDIPGMLNAVTEDMIDALVLAGTPDDVRKQLDKFEGQFETVMLLTPFFAVDPAESKANHEAIIDTFAA